MKTGEINLSEIQQTLTKMHVFDLFVHNVDRHLNNYLIRQQQAGFAVMAFDYSRAWVTNGFPIPDPRSLAATKTQVARDALVQYWGRDYMVPNAARQMLGSLERVPVAAIRNIIAAHPPSWLPLGLQEDILAWWESAARLRRLAAVGERIENALHV